jgi:diguanylate cyclase (GGDEF)-like protein/PAS domain S-box-containing protein
MGAGEGALPGSDRDAAGLSVAELRRAYAEQQLILDRSVVGFALLRDRKVLRCNRRYEEILGYGPGELVGQPVRLLYPSDEAYQRHGIEPYEVLARGEVYSTETTYRRRNGETFWARVTGTAVDPADPQRGSIWNLEDITQRKHTEQALERAYGEQKLIFDRSVVGISFIKNRIFLRCNRRMEEMFGYGPGEMHGQSTRIYFASQEDYEAMGVRVFDVLRRGESFIVESVYKRKNGELIWCRLNGTAIDASDPLAGSIWAFEDITQRKNVEAELQRSREELERLSRQDGLTGLANRRFFDDILRREFLRSARERTPLALVIGDTDCFKNYNDRHGHVQGDECLRRIAAAFAAVCRRPADLAARYGGEEFALVLPDTSLEAAANMAESLRQAVEGLAIPHMASTVGDRVTVSLGVATLVPRPGETPDVLVESADRALYEAKQQGRNRCVASRDR